jgi:LmbE family N-acetylglucosaminyl deacetylase
VAVHPTRRFGRIIYDILVKIIKGLGLAKARIRVSVNSAPIFVVAPHPDDEALMASGVILNALKAGQPVKVVIVSNGDDKGPEYGIRRQAESVTAMAKLGLRESDVIFLGYPGDVKGLIAMMNKHSTAETTYNSSAGKSSTYGKNGLGKTDFHSWLTGESAQYNAVNFQSDLEILIRAWRPLKIYTTSRFDAHPDHRGVYYFLTRVLQRVRLEDKSYAPTLYSTIIHNPSPDCYEDFFDSRDPAPELPVNFAGDYHWPYPPRPKENPKGLRFDASTRFSEPPDLWRTTLDWSKVQSFPVPCSMRSASQAKNLKFQVLTSYCSQPLRFLAPFCKQDEIFWQEHPPASNLLLFSPARLELKPNEAAVLTLAFAKESLSRRAITLESSDDTVAAVPPAVAVPAGATIAFFAVRGVYSGRAIVSASLDGIQIHVPVTVSATREASLGERRL